MKNHWVELILILLLLSFAFWLGQNWNENNQSPQSSEAEQHIDSLKGQMEDLYEEDLKDYARLKTMKDKYESANDILAKIMTIFLAELGMKISQKNIEDITAPITTSESLESEELSCPSVEEKQCPSLEQMARQQGKNLVDPGTTTSTAPDRSWTNNERKLRQVSTDSEVNDFLKSVEIQNFFSEITIAKGAGRRSLRRLQGYFEGTLYYDDSETKPADITMSLDGTWEEGKIVGKNDVKLSRNGETFSHSSGNGDLNGYKRPDTSSQAVFIDLGGKIGYLQLYFLDGNSTLIGNYYQQEDVGKFKKRGTARLMRR